WLREAEILDGNRMMPLGAKLKELGADNPLTWAVIWTNLARRSALVAWYVNNVPWGESYSKQELIEMLDDSLAKSSRENAITALVGLLRDTPLGKELGLGEVQSRGRQTAAITKRGWEQVHPVAVLYALYRYAERIGRYGLSLGELLEGAPEGPYTLFGLAPDRFAGLLKGLASRWEGWISVEMLRDLDNIYLNSSRSSTEVLDLA
ncbi:MAG: hypothetical protein H5T99_11410, partial [Moorella sp. (in: Bacteria)]|nr:hypothetical protein [Moorella sp. (in: firmicutes)]